MLEKETVVRSETPSSPALQGHGKEEAGSDSTTIPMPDKEEGAPVGKAKPEREPAAKDLLVGSSWPPTAVCRGGERC